MDSFVGTRRLIRLALRRDRIVLPVTLVLAILMVVGSAPALIEAYSEYSEQLSYVVSSAPSVVGRVFQGTVQGVNLGSIMMAEVYISAAVILAIMSIFIITRHTRHNEETGAGELIGSTEVGRSAPLSAALIVAIGANVVAAIAIFAGLISFPELDAAGSAYMAVSLGAVGIFFAGVAAITAQLSDYRRGANGMAIGVLAALFLIRGFGDAMGDLAADGLSVTASWLTWLSPLGWGYQVLPYNGNRLFPILMIIGVTIIAIGISYFMMNRRDIGSSIFHTKPGPKNAKQSLLSARGLAIRLQKGGLIGWSAGFVVFGGMMAIVANDFQETFTENEMFQELLASTGASGSLVDTIIAAMFPLMAAMLSAYVISALSKMQDEESSGRIEYLLGTALGRLKWLFSHVGFTIFGIFVNLGLMGAAGGLGYVLATSGGETTFMDIFLAALVSVPAMLLFMSCIVLVFSFVGRFVKTFAWTFYAYCALIGSLARIFTWPQWVTNFSPFVHTPAYPSNSLEWLPLYIMTGLSLVLLATAALFFSRRDISLK